MTKDFIVNYWSQLTVLLGVIGYIFKTIFDYKLKVKELKFKHFYELKAKKVVELYSKIVEIQMIVDRRKKGDTPSFENNIFKQRIELDKYFWESTFYLSPKAEKAFKDFLEWLKFFEVKEMIIEDPNIELKFDQLTQTLIAEFKNDIK